ncbi:HypC/HybG/HupF family hydrogenase formation chaperone [Methylomarinum sp. Ch1-1]|uniref:HypC/HybG/HupF family hydrogenase formation chaperone n=1 Tax=Methylomarinum roseum TaxID=3067653 RepID=A0AAU7NUJ2_9GAMM|nr:HypC/HybG/HupF family hydrogenase formation chaperone [Methylomarinum sp. Ch1-1]MDP4519291.1 HypC/HybG/HupF family hydrogenase formation chaperone [Methylomarinum sp. Ch1-1]
MCLAVPGQIIRISDDEPLLRTGLIDFSGVSREISLAYLPEAKADDYVIVHAGLAIALIDEEEAQASLQAFQELDDIEAAP